MTEFEDWKRVSGKKPERKFITPKVADDDWESEDYDDPYADLQDHWFSDLEEKSKRYGKNRRGGRGMKNIIAGLFGLCLIISFYAFVLFIALRTLDVESLVYSDCVILSACFVVVRYTDSYIVRESGKRN